MGRGSRINLIVACLASACLAAACHGSGGRDGIAAVPLDPPVLWQAPAALLDPPAALVDAGVPSTWTLQVDHALGTPPVGALGSFGIGNGHVFTQVGLTTPVGTWHGMAGPTYNKDDILGFFSDVRVFLDKDGERIARFDREGVWRHRASDVAGTAAEGSGLRLETLDVAPRFEAGGGIDPEARFAIVRRAFVENAGGDPARVRLVLRNVGFGGPRDGGVAEPRIGLERWCGTVEDRGAVASGTEVVVDLGTLAPGARASVDLLCAMGADAAGVDAARAAARAAGFDALLAATLADWARWWTGVTAIRTPDSRVNDLLDGLLVTIRASVASTGAVSQMSQYTRTWLRDHTGPVRYYLDRGLFDEVRGFLDYLYKASIQVGGISNSYRADFTFDALPPEPDWGSLPQGSGRQQAEGPSYVPILHEAYWRHTGDATLAAPQLEFLRYALALQQVSPEGLLPFSGDETFRVGMSFAFDLVPEGFPLQLEIPYDTETWSVQSGWLFVRGARALAALADATGTPAVVDGIDALAERVEQANGDYFRRPGSFDVPFLWRDTLEPAPGPFEDVNTQILWVDYLPADDPHAVDNLAATFERIGRPDGLMLTALGPTYQELLGFPAESEIFLYTGMVPGYGLWNLAVAGHPAAEAAFNAMGVVVDPGGNYGEIQILQDGVSRMFQVWYGDVISLPWSDYTARYRTWEGGINGDAIWQYLLGLRADAPGGTVALAPRLPNRWPEMTVESLRVGATTLDLVVRRTPAWGYAAEIVHRAGPAIDVVLALPAEHDAPRASVNGAAVAAEVVLRPFGERVVEFDALRVAPEARAMWTVD